MTRTNNSVNCTQGVIYSDDLQWVRKINSGPQNWFTIDCSADGMKVFAAINNGYVNSKIYYSYNAGSTWTPSNSIDSYWSEIHCSNNGEKLIAISNSDIYTSLDSGLNWSVVTAFPGYAPDGCCISNDGSFMAFCGDGTGTNRYIYTSSDSGANWTEQTGSPMTTWQTISCSASGSILVAAVFGGYIYTSTDSGVNWTQRVLGDASWYSSCMSYDGSIMYVSQWNNKKTYKSSDYGANWAELTNSPAVYAQQSSCSADGSKILIGDIAGYVWLSTDYGSTWTQQNIENNLSGEWRGVAVSKNGNTYYATQNNTGYIYSIGNAPNFPISKCYSSTLSVSAQNLTTSFSYLSGLEVTLPYKGLYKIAANIVEDISTLTNSASANYSTYQIYSITNSPSGAISSTERIGTQISSLTSAVSGVNAQTIELLWYYDNFYENNTLRFYGKINSSVTGNWSIKSDSIGRTNLITRLST